MECLKLLVFYVITLFTTTGRFTLLVQKEALNSHWQKLAQLGYSVLHAKNIAPDGSHFEHARYDQVVLIN